MKILVIGDPHLKASSLPLVEKFLQWISDLIASSHPDMIVNLGDTFHTHNVVRSEVMALVTKHVKVWTQRIRCITLIGNHDMAHPKAPDIHAWLPFIGYDNLYIIDKPHIIDGFYFIPYIDCPDQFDKILSEAMNTAKYIFCHQTFRNANFGFMKSKEGAIVPLTYDGLIISGHIHKTQQLGPVWYPGTPFAQEASDHNEDKGVYMIDTNTNKREIIRSPLPKWMTYTADAQSYFNVISSMNKTDKNHLVIKGTLPELRSIMNSREFRDLKNEYNFTVKKDVISLQHEKTRSISTLEGAVVYYIDNIYDGLLDRDILKKICLESLI